MSMRNSLRGSPLCAFALGALSILAYAPFDQAWIAILTFSVSFFYLSSKSPRKIFQQAFFFGLGYYGLGISWVLVSVSTFVSPFILAFFIMLGLIILMSIFLSLSFWLLQTIPCSPLLRLLFIYPLGATLYESGVTDHLLQFPWLMIGVAMVDTPLAHYAPIFGALGVSYLVFLSAGLVAARQLRYGIFALSLWTLGYALSFLTFVHPKLETQSLSAIQANIPVSEKWDITQLQTSLRLMVTLITQQKHSDWIIGSENGFPALYSEIPFLINRLDQDAKDRHAALVIGLPIDEDENYYNSALVLGEGYGRYDKHLLVPFGEYTPLKTWINPLLRYWQIPMSDFSEGEKKQPLAVLKSHPVALFSCFETIFSSHLRQQLQSAEAIIILSDDGWFGYSFAAHQQFQTSRMRAKELGRALVSVGNTGITAIVDQNGHIQQQLPLHQRAVLHATLSLFEGETPYTRFGVLPYFFLIIMIYFLLSLLGKIFKIERLSLEKNLF